MKKEVILKFEDNQFTTAEVKDGIIKGFNEYYLGEFKNGYEYKEMISWFHEHNGVKSGMPESSLAITATDDDREKFDDVYEHSVGHCGSCGDAHDMDDYQPDYIMGDGYLVCKSCAEPEDVLIPIENVDSIYESKNLVGMDLAGYEKIEEIFHDCGWGGPATDHNGAKNIIDDLLEEHGELYCGLTGVGQFQVYVGIFKKTA